MFLIDFSFKLISLAIFRENFIYSIIAIAERS